MNIKKAIIFTILIAFVFSSKIQAKEYYVNSLTGNDTNIGDKNSPWKTIQKASNTLIAGDTVFIMAGTYTPTQKIEPINSGTNSNYINYLTYPGDEQLVIIDGVNIPLPNWFGVFTISSKNYIKVSGIKVINSSYAGIFIEKSSNIILENNHIDKTHSSGISVWDCNNITIDRNEVRHACWPTGGLQECITISNTNLILVKNNLVYDGGSIGFGGGGEGIDLKDGCTNGIVSNNMVHNVASVGIYIDAYKRNQSNIHVLKNTVYNVFGVGIATVSEEGGSLENVIISKNIVSNCDERAMVIHWTNKPNYIIKNIYVQHNTFYNNGEGLDIGVHSLGENINIINNIFSKNSIYQIQNSSTDMNINELHIKNNLFDGDNPSWALLGDNYIIDNPEFISVLMSDFKLQGTSPAINEGIFLTKTKNSETGTVIELEDVGFFTNGYGIREGDLVKFEGQTQQFEILEIDYINNTITLDKTLSWNAGDGVSLVYNDDMPDLGAYEYENSLGLFSHTIENLITYPNPTKDIIYISDKYLNDSYQIISINGRIVKKGKINADKINITSINSGIYFLKIVNAKSNRILISKLIKE